MFKANCQSCLTWLGKRPRRAACLLKPSKHCDGNSKNGFTRRNRCIWSSKTLQKQNEMTEDAQKSNGGTNSNHEGGAELKRTRDALLNRAFLIIDSSLLLVIPHFPKRCKCP